MDEKSIMKTMEDNVWKWAAVGLMLYIALDYWSPSEDPVAAPRSLAGEGGGGWHPHEAMFFFVLAIAVGTLMLNLSSCPIFHNLQQSVILFVLGVFTSFFMRGLSFAESLGPVGRSYEMWMAIDPHVLLFTLLPPLLAGDAMTIDTHVAKKVANQCLFLAGPGVLINALITAAFLYLYLPYDWPFMLCLTTGSILCATDPVAVVALLKELGASPTLTVQIQGESLLNDGTAIVLYFVSYELLKGRKYDSADIVVLLVKMTLYAVLFGMLIGGIFFLWMRGASNRYSHQSSMIQVSLTIACAYLSFTLAEGLFHISGVLATVSASLVLADKMWPEVVSHETIHTIWHIFEYLGNTIIFFLAGALTGRKMLDIAFVDYCHLLVIYAALLIIRCSMIMLSRPILRMLHADRKPVPVADALVMGWGGLRGAVGLALAIQVSIDLAGGRMDHRDGDRVLFYVGGVALLTLVINATTCPHLVTFLGITQTPANKKRIMKIIHSQLGEMVQAREVGVKSRESIKEVMADMEHHIDPTHDLDKPQPEEPEEGELDSTAGGDIQATVFGQATALVHWRGSGGRRSSGRSSARTTVRASIHGGAQRIRASVAKGIAKGAGALQNTDDLLDELKTLTEKFDALEDSIKDRVKRELPPEPLFDRIPEMEDVVKTKGEQMDRKFIRAINEAFLAIVQSQYWKLMSSNLASTSEAGVLLSSVKAALSDPSYDLKDLNEITNNHVTWPVPQESRLIGSLARDKVSNTSSSPDRRKSTLRRVLESTAFDMMIMFAIVTNTVFILIEDYSTDANLSRNRSWIVVEILFTTIFTIEFLLRFADAKLRYFLDAWNMFDFILVVIGIADMIVTVALNSSIGAKQGTLARAAKITRVLRAVRFVRFLRMWAQLQARIAGKQTSEELADHMEKFDILNSFITGHLNAQKELVQYFGDHLMEMPEVARCILQSFVEVHKAMYMCAYEETFLDEASLEETRMCRETIGLAEELENFVLEARRGGVLTAAQAELLINIMHDHVHMFSVCIDDVRLGRTERQSLQRGASHSDEGFDGHWGFGPTPVAEAEGPIPLLGAHMVDRE